jgi:hypothetical protein
LVVRVDSLRPTIEAREKIKKVFEKHYGAISVIANLPI